MDPTLLLILVAGGGAIVGALLASVLVRRAESSARERLAQLTLEHAKLRSELESRNAEIATHFGRTSDLFRELTERYTRLYAHLAEGARQFCADDVPAIARGLDGLLPAGEDGSGSALVGEDASGSTPAAASEDASDSATASGSESAQAFREST